MTPTEQIRAIRAKTGLSQARFSKQYGIPCSTYEKWESGDRTPPPYVINLLKLAVNLTLKGEQPMNHPAPASALDGTVIEVPLLKHRDYSFSATDTPDLAQYEDVFFGERDGSLEQSIREITLRAQVVRYRLSGSLSLFDPDLPSVGIEADRLDENGKSVGKYLLLYIVAEEMEDLPPNPIWTEYVDVTGAPPDDIRALP